MSIPLKQTYNILKECISERFDFYKKWYSENTFSETIFDTANDVYKSAVRYLEPYAIKALSGNTFSNKYIDPVAFSEESLVTSGSFNGTLLLFSALVVGFPDFINEVLHGRITPESFYNDFTMAFKDVDSLLKDYSKGNEPIDPYEKGKVAAITFGKPILMLAGLIKSGNTFYDIGKGALGNVPRNFATLATNEGFAFESSIVSSKLIFSTDEMALDMMYMSQNSNTSTSNIAKGIKDESRQTSRLRNPRDLSDNEILQALIDNNYNRRAAAEALGVDPGMIYMRIRRAEKGSDLANLKGVKGKSRKEIDITDQQIADAIVANNFNRAAAAEALGVDPGLVYSRIQRAEKGSDLANLKGVKGKSRREIDITDQQIADAIVASNFNQAAAAAALNIDSGVVYARIQRAKKGSDLANLKGVRGKSRNVINVTNDEIAEAMINNNYNIVATAETLGVDPGMIYMRIRRAKDGSKLAMIKLIKGNRKTSDKIKPDSSTPL